MELVCNIPDKLYRKWETSKFTLEEAVQFVDCVMKGIPLSKHYDLIERDTLKQRIASVFPMVSAGVISEIDTMATIIPATKEGTE